ncbi:MAG: helicase-exonuclease AddAB subunit AddA [Acutalibacteraceae bacterium]
MAVTWTDNQQNAINARGGSLLVSAAAGSGKTAVLVERIISMITDSKNPVDADRLLVVTYTRAAAKEMRDRICDRIDELLKINPYDSNLRRQQMLMNNAHISTIHSFCSDFVRENFYLLDISNDFRIADDGELKMLKHKAMETSLDLFYQNNSQDFAELADSFSTAKNDEKLKKVILKLYEFLLSHPFPEEWMTEKLDMYDDTIDSSKTVWGTKICEYAQSAAEYALKLSKGILNLIKEEPDIFEKAIDLVNSDIDYFNRVLDSLKGGDWDKIIKVVNSFEAGTFSVKRGYKDYPPKIKAAADRNIVKNVVDELKKLFFQSDFDCKDDIKTLRPIIGSLFECVIAFSKEFSRLKRQKNIADFNDLEHWTLQLLVEKKDGKIIKTKTAEKASLAFDAVMIDEYQDANEVQDLIFSAVSKDEKNLFVVGDVKQSIYGFRQAMPEIFIARKERTILYNAKNQEQPSRIVLDKNFRSRSGITDATNFVFDSLMSKEVGDIEYDGEERLTPGAQYPDSPYPQTELHLIETDDETDACTKEALYIVDLIMKMKKEPCITENGVLRNAENGDFAILLRNTKKYAHIYVDILKQNGIFAYSEITERFLDMPEISVILNFLKIIDNPAQDIPLLSVMMSPIYGFTADDMAKIRTKSRHTNLYSAVSAYAEKGDEKCTDFIKTLRELRTFSITLSVDALINKIFEMTGYVSVSSAVAPYSNAVNNLRLLQEYAREFEKNGYRGLSSFVAYIDTLKQQDENLKAAADDNGLQFLGVRVMSIHKSKGLQFPVCIIANTSRLFVSDKSEEIQLHSKMGFASKRVDKERMCRYTTMPREALCIENMRSEKSEELRILYVAMTRAKERLIMLSTSKNIKKYVTSISSQLTDNDKISPYIVRSAKKLSDWIVMCALIHPSGNDLRSLAGRDVLSFKKTDTSSWNIVINTSDEFTEETDFSQESSQNEAETEHTYNVSKEKSDFIKAVLSRITFEYKNAPLKALPVKIAASELAHKDNKLFDKILTRPAFATEQALTAAQKGTALHKYMQFCDFAKARENPKGELVRLYENGRLTQAERNSIDLRKVEAFVNSDIITAAISSSTVYKEFRFTVKIDAELLDNTLKPPFDKEKILLQGAVDLAYEKDGKLVLVDYKTDRVPDMQKLKEMYKNQLLIYKDAMEQCTDYSVSDCYIYSLYNSDCIKV